MNTLSILNPNQQTMSTREIAKLLGKQHSHIKSSAEALRDRGCIGLRDSHTTNDQNGQSYHEYHLNKNDSIVLVAQNCPEFTAAIVARWQELEGAASKAISSSTNIDYMIDSATAEFKLNLVSAIQKTISYQLKKGLPERQSSKPEPLSNDEIKDIATSLYFDGKHPKHSELEDSESGITAIKRKTVGNKLVWRLRQYKPIGKAKHYCIDSTCSGDLIKAVKKLILLEIKKRTTRTMKISDIKNWFEVAVPEPTIEQACVQIGCHYEEVAEMAEAINDGALELEAARVGGEYKSQNANYLDAVYEMTDYDKVRLLDAMCDQIVTAVGIAHMLGMDIEGALAEVNRSNHSKFENGKAVFNDQGKIMKGKDYFPPELLKYIGNESQ